MRYLVFLVIFVLQSCQADESSDNVHQYVGKEFTSGKSMAFSEFKGQYVYIDFWASCCPPCVESLPFFEKEIHPLEGNSFKLVVINIDEDKQDAIDFLQQHPISYLNLYDPFGKLGMPLGVSSMPTGFLVDPKGKVIYKHIGFSMRYGRELKKLILEKIKTAGK
ncbi:MAG: TlpA disulfide reductase family protein [Enterobacterales bacterium]|nr:TlpA disulfide reductase family protein [Enterobacterales bacterium]